MKISLLTIWHINNYGAELQTYATVKALQSLGHEVEVIDLRLSDIGNKSFKAKLLDFVAEFGPSSRKFKKFWKRYIPKTCHYRSSKELYHNPPEADLFLVGSDQVWNPAITKKYSLLFFLDFIGSNAKKVSYASSFGTSEWMQDESTTAKVRSLLNDFDKVSCREIHGVNILNDVFQLSAIRVLDPTMLFDNYPEFLNGSDNEKNSLVFYSLSQDKQLEQLAKDIAYEKGIEFKNNNVYSMLLNKRVWNKPSIEEWLKTIHDSEFVVTDSFHGTVFSILFQKQFIVIYNGSKSSRILSLLKDLQLLDRHFTNVEDAYKSQIWTKGIDYSSVNKNLEELRKISWDYLKQL